MKKRLVPFFLSIIFGLAAIFCTNSLFAQNYQTFRSEIDNISTRAKWRFGPFYLVPIVQLNLEYDNNIYGVPSADKPVSDYVATISPQITAHVLFRKWLILSFSESPQYVYFARIENERALNNSYSPAFRFLFLNRFVLSGTYHFSRAKNRGWGEINVRFMEEGKGYSGSIFYDTSRNTSLGFSGLITKISYEDVTLPHGQIPLSRALNREERTGRIEFYYRIFSESSFFLNFSYTKYKFDDLQANFRDSYSYQTYAGIRFPLLGRARGILSLGYKKFIPRQTGLKGFSGVVGDTGLDFRIGRFGFRFQFIRDISFSYGGSIFYLINRYGGGLSFYPAQFMRLDYDFFQAEGKYPESEQLLQPDGTYVNIKRKNIDRSHSIGVIFRIIKNTGIGLTVNYSERKSNYYLQNMNRLFLGSFITYSF